MSEFPKDGGPNSFDEMRRGLRRRKAKLHQRNIQIKDLLFRFAERERVIERYKRALVSLAASCRGIEQDIAKSALQDGEGGSNAIHG